MFMKSKKILIIFISLIFLILIALFSIRFGSVNFPFGDIIKALFIKSEENQIISSILWDIRIPRILIALMVGANLSLAGVLFLLIQDLLEYLLGLVYQL